MPQATNTSRNAQTGEVTTVIVPWTVETLTAEIAAIRYTREISGCDDPVETNLTLDTSRESQALMTSAVLGSVVDPLRQYAWKFLGGEVRQRSNTQIQAMGKAIMDHVQACRVRESDLIQRLADGEDPETVADDRELNWP